MIFKNILILLNIMSDLTQEDSAEECPVCYLTITEQNIPNAQFFQCEHILCHPCHDKLYINTCPLCRAESDDN